ncbi:hypothetical protein EJB05_17005, partial [Eragrostis curvula]
LWDVGDNAFHHLLDCYATLVRVSFRRGRATGESNVDGLSGAALTAHGQPQQRAPCCRSGMMCLTETTKSTVLVDPGTLDTVGKLQSAHPVVTMAAGRATRGRVIYRTSGLPRRADVLRDGRTRSFAVTEKYVVVPEMPLRYSARPAVASVDVPPFMPIHFSLPRSWVIVDCCEHYCYHRDTCSQNRLGSFRDKDVLPAGLPRLESALHPEEHGAGAQLEF